MRECSGKRGPRSSIGVGPRCKRVTESFSKVCDNTNMANGLSRVSPGCISPVLRHCATGGWPGGSRRSQAGGQVLPCRRPASETKLNGWWEVVNPSTIVGTGMSALTVSGEFCMFVVNLRSADMGEIASARTACLHLRRRCCEPITVNPPHTNWENHRVMALGLTSLDTVACPT